MKRFLLKLGLTVLALLAVAWVLDGIVTRNLCRSDARMFSTYNAIFGDSLRCDAVIMGSSRGLVQYSPRILDSIVGTDSYNLGVDGRCIDAEVVAYNLYRRHAPKPRLIIQNVDNGTLQRSNRYEREQYLPYLDRDGLYRQVRHSEGFTWVDRWLPLMRYAGYREVLKEGLGLPNKLARPAMYKGYAPSDATWDGSGFQKIDTIGFECHPEAVALFDRYLAQCQRDSIKVVLVFAPSYIGIMEKMGNAVDTMFALYQAFADRYGCTVLNYHFDSICYDTTYFYNAVHLNRKGAERFTTQLAHDLKDLMP